GRRLAGWLGIDDVQLVLSEVRRAAPSVNRAAARTTGSRAQPSATGAAAYAPAGGSSSPSTASSNAAPNPFLAPTDPASRRQREALKLALQYPKLAGGAFDGLGPEEFTSPAYAAVHAAIVAAGGASAALDPMQWLSNVIAAASDDAVRTLINRLAVEPLMLRENAKGGQSVD